MPATTAKMDDANRAMCYALRHPPGRKTKPMKYTDIRKLVRKTDGRLPTISSIAEAAATYMEDKGQRGRPQGSCKTSKEEDKIIMDTFHRLRPPGYGITAPRLKRDLPEEIRKKISAKTVTRCQGSLNQFWFSKWGAAHF